MYSPWLQKVLKDADLRRNRAKKRRMEEDKEEFKQILVFTVMVKELYRVPRSPSLFRKRWDDHYLGNLDVYEDSFVKEYRLNPKAFDILLELLLPRLSVNGMEMQRIFLVEA